MPLPVGSMMVRQTINSLRTVRLLFILPALVFFYPANAQKYSLEKSIVQFNSDATIEDIKADNTKASGLFNMANGEVAFSMPIKDFEFEKALMKEHFNEKYLESHLYPKAIFQGRFPDVKKEVEGEQLVKAAGKLTIHGVTKEVTIPGTVELRRNQIVARSKFIIHLADFNIKVPTLLWQNIAEDVEVSVEFIFKPL
jgi:polyisoprenoid-binding protein YceI